MCMLAHVSCISAILDHSNWPVFDHLRCRDGLIASWANRQVHWEGWSGPQGRVQQTVQDATTPREHCHRKRGFTNIFQLAGQTSGYRAVPPMSHQLADDNTMEPTAPSKRLVSKRNVKFAPHHSLIEAVRQGTLGQLPDASFLRGGGYKHRSPSFCRSFMMSLLITVFSESIVLLLQPAPYT